MSQSGLHQGVSDAKKKKIKRGASTWNVLMMLTPATPGNALWVARVERHWLVCEPSRQSALSEPRLVQVRAHLLPVRRLAPAGTLVDRYRRRSSTRTRTEEAPFWRRPSPTTPTSTSSLAARPQTRPSPTSSVATPRRRAASGASPTQPTGTGKASGRCLTCRPHGGLHQKRHFRFPVHLTQRLRRAQTLVLRALRPRVWLGRLFPRGTSAQRTAPSGARGRATRSTAASKRRSTTSTCTTQSRPRPRSYSTSGTRLKGRRRQPIPASFSNRPSS